MIIKQKPIEMDNEQALKVGASLKIKYLVLGTYTIQEHENLFRRVLNSN
jgi:hypothetical protein